MFGFLKNWLRHRRLERARIPDTEWRATVANLPLLTGLKPGGAGALARSGDLYSVR
jgi:Mlc titration factor MtfA (ptsG expression regulator)